MNKQTEEEWAKRSVRAMLKRLMRNLADAHSRAAKELRGAIK